MAISQVLPFAFPLIEGNSFECAVRFAVRDDGEPDLLDVNSTPTVVAVAESVLKHLHHLIPESVADPVRIAPEQYPAAFTGPSFGLAYLLSKVSCYWRPKRALETLSRDASIWATGQVSQDGQIQEVGCSELGVKLKAFLAPTSKARVFIVPTHDWALLQHSVELASGPIRVYTPSDLRGILVNNLVGPAQPRGATSSPIPDDHTLSKAIIHVGDARGDLDALLDILFVRESGQRFGPSRALRMRIVQGLTNVVLVSRTVALGLEIGFLAHLLVSCIHSSLAAASTRQPLETWRVVLLFLEWIAGGLGILFWGGWLLAWWKLLNMGEKASSASSLFTPHLAHDAGNDARLRGYITALIVVAAATMLFCLRQSSLLLLPVGGVLGALIGLRAGEVLRPRPAERIERLGEGAFGLLVFAPMLVSFLQSGAVLWAVFTLSCGVILGKARARSFWAACSAVSVGHLAIVCLVLPVAMLAPWNPYVSSDWGETLRETTLTRWPWSSSIFTASTCDILCPDGRAVPSIWVGVAIVACRALLSSVLGTLEDVRMGLLRLEALRARRL